MAQEFTFTVNGVERTTTQNKPLLRYLRDDLHIHSAKDGCSEGACGTCTIHVDGAAVKACVLTTALAAGRNIVTVEGLPEDVREAFVYAFGVLGADALGRSDTIKPPRSYSVHQTYGHGPDRPKWRRQGPNDQSRANRYR